MNRPGERLSDLTVRWAKLAEQRGATAADVDPQLVAEAELREAEQDRNTRLVDRWLAMVPRRYLDATVDDVWQPETERQRLIDWLADAKAGDAGNLVLLGDVGVGKTYAAAALARALHFGNWRVGFWNVAKLMDAMRARFDGRPGPDVDSLTRLDVLVLDDVGKENRKDWVIEQEYRIIDERVSQMRPTVVTSNLPAGQLRDWLTEATYDRLREGVVPLVFRGESRRHPKPHIPATIPAVAPDGHSDAR